MSVCYPAICATCASIGLKYAMKCTLTSPTQDLWSCTCTNPNHVVTKMKSRDKFGRWYSPKMKQPPKRSYVSDGYVYYWDGQQERKIKKSYLESIRSRAYLPGGKVLEGKEGEKYNQSIGQKQTQKDLILG